MARKKKVADVVHKSALKATRFWASQVEFIAKAAAACGVQFGEFVRKAAVTMAATHLEVSEPEFPEFRKRSSVKLAAQKRGETPAEYRKRVVAEATAADLAAE